MIASILCTGPSMSQAVADSVRGTFVVAVNATYELAPWADVLVANDSTWWHDNPNARNFAGRKVAATCIVGVTQISGGMMRSDLCSGVVALEVAARAGATEIRLYGADFGDGHYFGDYADGRNTTAARRDVHRKQFADWRDSHPDARVVNYTPGSRLDVFEFAPC